ncbi:ArsO family NAD(P)H-dependent flavin-containing monooxygenase [Stenotrophomonas sp. NPDC078853]|uniref:ArsO family NAD(P)H-dependent flavin-containing monooxygenase n=1 Tax=Stenotrophomonas sp. NPDC078853 TaxID=3364534 RepID=UPI0038504E2A
MESVDVVVIGGGQSGLAAGYFLRRSGLSYVILDVEAAPGGAWQHTWESLHLFSPAGWSSIPGWPMPASRDAYPARAEVIDYLTRYEHKYALPVVRPVRVQRISRSGDQLLVDADDGRQWQVRAVISATGTWRHPYRPAFDGLNTFAGVQLHSAHYRNPEPFAGLRVAIIGGGNSGAQILAEVSKVAQTTWITQQKPEFLADDVDGRVLFERATEKWRAQQEGREPDLPQGGFGDIVMVPPVVDARQRGVLASIGPPARFTATGMQWPDGSERTFDAVIWCTGFRPAVSHLEGLGLIDAQGQIDVDDSKVRSVAEPAVWLLGYGDWNGTASATLIGVTRYAREVVRQVTASNAPTNV